MVPLDSPTSKPGMAKFPSPCGVESDNEEANAYVNQGLTLRYAFNDNEAVCSFRKAQELAPDCALACKFCDVKTSISDTLAHEYSKCIYCFTDLFESLSAGPNVNYAVIESSGAYSAILTALLKAEEILKPSEEDDPDPANEKVVDFFNALYKRYVPPGETLDSMLAIQNETARLETYSLCGNCNALYAMEMYEIHLKYPDDNDMAAVAVGGLMQSPAWRWWQPGSEYYKLGSEPILETNQQLPNATRANTILKTILSRDPNHLGANHYMIHNLEMSPTPEWVWVSCLDLIPHSTFHMLIFCIICKGVADNIEKLDKYDGHISHMASHIYSRLGYYDKVIAMNKRSNKVDFQWIKDRTGG